MEKEVKKNEDRWKELELTFLGEQRVYDQLFHEWSNPSPQSSDGSYSDMDMHYFRSNTATEDEKRASTSSSKRKHMFVELDEPWVLRASIYNKFIAYFQGLYNSHDATALVSRLFQPCCSPDMKRELRLWSHQSTKTGLSPIEYYSNLEDVETPAEADVFRLVGIRRVSGSERIFRGYQHMFDKLPDCVMTFHSHCSTVRHLEESGKTIVIAPYTYYFSVLVPMKDDLLSSTTSQRKLKVVETECRVWYVTCYNAQGLVERDCFHIVITACNDPNVTQNDIVEYIGLEGLTIRDEYDWK
jgi:hypothetical protein